MRKGLKKQPALKISRFFHFLIKIKVFPPEKKRFLQCYINNKHPLLVLLTKSVFMHPATRWQCVNSHLQPQLTAKQKHWSCQHPHRLSQIPIHTGAGGPKNNHELPHRGAHLHTKDENKLTQGCSLCGSRRRFIRNLHSCLHRSLTPHTGAFTCPASEAACFGWI